MNKALAVVLATVLIGVCAGGALAQVPFIQAYFDNDYNETQSDCRAPGSASSLYVAALNLNILVSAIDYKMHLPPSLMYLGEAVNITAADSKIGDSVGDSNPPTGLAISYNLPRNGFATLLLSRVVVEWTGQCDCYSGPQPLVVGGYDDVWSPIPRAIAWPYNTPIDVVGMTSLICPGAVSTEKTTWGGVKALYR